MSNSYKNIIFTKHALERMDKRSISKDKIWQVVNHPDKTFTPKSADKNDSGGYKNNIGNSKKVSRKYLKKISDRKYQAIATYLPKEKKYLVISTCVRGEDDKQNIIWWIIKKLFSKRTY
ncbi:DUF4258 domain-containing protein [Patescibacteria group bacterium]|nr:DUF4258 domain-containing protein [Patescibacteria group bacterium]